METIISIENLIKKDQLEDAMSELLNLKNLKPKIRNEIIHLQARYSRLQKEKMLGTIDEKYELNQIRLSLISIKDSLPLILTTTISNNSKNYSKYIILILFSAILFLSILLYSAYEKIKDQTDEHIIAITKLKEEIALVSRQNNIDQEKSFIEYITFGNPKSIWNGTVFIKSKSHYSGINLDFDGIHWVDKSANPRDKLSTLITVHEGQQFYLKRSTKQNSNWGVNVLSKDSLHVELQFFPRDETPN